jgi:hypothetical protein
MRPRIHTANNANGLIVALQKGHMHQGQTHHLPARKQILPSPNTIINVLFSIDWISSTKRFPTFAAVEMPYRMPLESW